MEFLRQAPAFLYDRGDHAAKQRLQSKSFDRSALRRERRVLASRRFSREASVGRVGLRLRGTCAAAATSAFSRASASARFISRLRCDCALMTTTPVRVTRWSPRRRRRSLTAGGSDEERTSKRRCTALETLLTFWPPAPCARTAVSWTSLSRTFMGQA